MAIEFADTIYAIAPSNAAYNFGTQNGTWGGWVWFNSVGVYAGIMSRWALGQQFMIQVSNVPKWTGLVFLANGSAKVITFSGGISDPAIDQWFHVVMVLDNGTLRMYINGVEADNTGDATADVLADSEVVLRLARNSSTGELDGLACELAMGNKALSASEVLMWYAGGTIMYRMPLAVFGDNLKGYWPMIGTEGVDVEAGATIIDESPVRNHATPQGTPIYRATPMAVLGAGPLIVQAAAEEEPPVGGRGLLKPPNKRGWKQLNKIGFKL